ncbi:hypothetical protein LSAT2_012549 [Lamellibrachia satsuma]|nr:hypothetical protein LSAT2_012549 [Lamellibrachia satsuma]
MIGKLATWFFAMDRTHYSRWVSFHMRDMIRLKDTHPSVYRQFAQDHFTVPKTGHTSSMALHQTHEQLNEVIKGDGGGGGVGLTENPAKDRSGVARHDTELAVKSITVAVLSRTGKVGVCHSMAQNWQVQDMVPLTRVYSIALRVAAPPPTLAFQSVVHPV